MYIFEWLHTGAFGIVYRASLSDWGESRRDLVAVKTLKGMKIDTDYSCLPFALCV